MQGVATLVKICVPRPSVLHQREGRAGLGGRRLPCNPPLLQNRLEPRDWSRPATAVLWTPAYPRRVLPSKDESWDPASSDGPF